jgi:hypothetical protein
VFVGFLYYLYAVYAKTVMPEYLFSYGTLQKESVQMQLFGRQLNAVKDVLEGYKVVTIEIKDPLFLAKGEDKYQSTLVPSPDRTDMIKGVALEISSHELALADKYEPDNYKRIKIELQSGKEAWIYVAV